MVWFLAANSKTTLSPGFALMLDGVNVRPPSPTTTVWVVPVAEGLAALAALLEDGLAEAEDGVAGAEDGVAGADADAEGAAEEEAAGGAAAPTALALKAPN
jgi:hypothetical protein